MLHTATAEIARPDVMEQLLLLDQAVLDAFPVGVCVCDLDGRIIRVNRRAEELWGQKGECFEPARRFCGWFRVETLTGVRIPPESTPMADAIRRGASCRGIEVRIENPDGKRWVAALTVQPLYDAYGRVAGAINCFHDVTREYEHRESLTRQQKNFDLAMVASKMGTWRYTMADNICVYDANAQRLYGLTEARFLHDANGVKAKFHPADMELMWSRVAKACDPNGDGIYDVEYRVKQLDGTWKWLSAWGFVEFEGEGENRKPVAITGASRDISELMQANESQKILIHELNHRVKNMLATVQSIAMQTQRSTPGAFFERFDARLMALSRAHDLLTQRQWTGVDLRELLRQSLAPFMGDTNPPINIQGPDLILPARAALAFCMVTHELATNAAKYGALSTPVGHVSIEWTIATKDHQPWLSLHWAEKGGPAATPPTRRGFGSRLIEHSIRKDLAGEAELQYLPAGLQCRLAFPLATDL
ncbi:MAG TPA: HWE histidine kinase domain-containing protein [Micropepsaceae bacterium]|nr:HWE histidine kinase domain-containing protein [Micropepsaceae bacterium]